MDFFTSLCSCGCWNSIFDHSKDFSSSTEAVQYLNPSHSSGPSNSNSLDEKGKNKKKNNLSLHSPFSILKEGVLIKKGDYVHFRYFKLFQGELRYYELKTSSRMENGKQIISIHIQNPNENQLRGKMLLHSSKTLDSSKDEFIYNPKTKEIQISGFSPCGSPLVWKLQASNQQDFHQWSHFLRLAMRPRWQPNQSYCQICHMKFGFWTRRPKHCRKCGICACSFCIPFLEKLPFLGYYQPVSICCLCHPMEFSKKMLQIGTCVLVYHQYIGKIHSIPSKSLIGIELSSPSIDQISKSESSCIFFYVSPRRLSSYSEYVLAATRIKQCIRKHLSWMLFRAQLGFHTWNLLESLEEQKAMNIVDQLRKSISVGELRSMIPHLPTNDLIPTPEKNEMIFSNGTMKTLKERWKMNLTNMTIEDPTYHGIHLPFPLRLESVVKLIEFFRDGNILHPFYTYQILKHAITNFQPFPSMRKVNLKEKQEKIQLIIVGDLHGQLEDLLTIFQLNGLPCRTTWYLFNGDFVDRGSHGVEVMLILLCFTLLYPKYVFLNRGNHEARLINEVFGFEEEIQLKYGKFQEIPYQFQSSNLFEMFQEVFNLLSLCTLIEEKVLVMHGGLSQYTNVSLSTLQTINHHQDPPTSSQSLEDEVFVSLLWSDPRDLSGFQPSGRGAGIEFGMDITETFCIENNIDYIIRSHECKEGGYEIEHNGRMITIFSASSYCGTQTNQGAFCILTNEIDSIQNEMLLEPHFHQFHSQPLQHHAEIMDSWRNRVCLLEEKVIHSIGTLICHEKHALLRQFIQQDPQRSGWIRRLEWARILREILNISIPFLLYSSQLLEFHWENEESNEPKGKKNPVQLQEWIQYQRFLDRFHIQSSDVFASFEMDFLTKIAFQLFKLLGIHDVNEAFTCFDREQDGQIHFHEFSKTLKAISIDLSEKQMNQIFEVIDTNGNGKIDYVEFAEHFHRVFQQLFQEERMQKIHFANGLENPLMLHLLNRFGCLLYSNFSTLKQAFEEIDKEKKGFLTFEDLKTWVWTQNTEPYLTEEQIHELIESILEETHSKEAFSSSSSSSRHLQWKDFAELFTLDTNTIKKSISLSNVSSMSSFQNGNENETLVNPKMGNNPSSCTIMYDLITPANSPGLSHPSSTISSISSSPTVSITSSSSASWIQSLLQLVTQCLHKERLYMKFLFRSMDSNRIGWIQKEKFLAGMTVMNQQIQHVLTCEQLNHLANGLVCFLPSSLIPQIPSEKNEIHEKIWIPYMKFLNSLQVIDTKMK